ncbi:hypothetical protein GCM10022631_34430 [Deinococcus rubellus]|uniref:CPBP family intramembrane metalloprotease n=1 Tax=Deinococcus rubellus TaxID=1889240 RepID=A0ABY5YEJ8_9DEIO|nr:hypothetical protein [Deinococcus rubellus]UWX63500.1 hypothetical protein N0D28_12215 [Deinococcus rubellus]
MNLFFGLGLGALSVGAVLGALALAGLFRSRGLQAMPEGVTLSHFPYFMRQLGWQLALSPAEVGLFFTLPLWLLRRWLPLWATVLLTVVLFGAAHYARPHVTPLLFLAIAVVVGVPTVTLSLVRGFWAAVGWHFAWNLLLGPVFGLIVAGQDIFGWFDSLTSGAALWTGGLYGPEGSLTACLVNGGLFGWMLWQVFRKRLSLGLSGRA